MLAFASCEASLCADETGACITACLSHGGWEAPTGDFGTVMGTGSGISANLGHVKWLRKFGGVGYGKTVYDGNVSPTPAGDLVFGIDYSAPMDLGDGTTRGKANTNNEALLHLSSAGQLVSVHDGVPFLMSYSETVGHDPARRNGYSLVGSTLYLWDLNEIHTLAPNDTTTTWAKPGVGIYAAQVAAGSGTFLGLVSAATTWNSVPLPKGYVFVQVNTAGQPVWAKLLSSKLNVTLASPPRLLTSSGGATHYADWIHDSAGQWFYDGVVRGTAPSTGKAAYLLVIDQNGAFAWGKTLSTAHAEDSSGTRPFALALDPQSKLVSVQRADMNAGAGAYGTSGELAIVRYDAAGTPTLVTKFAAAEVVDRSGLAFRSDGSFLFTGSYAGTWAVGGKSLDCKVSGARCGFAIAFSSTGAIQWLSAETNCATESRFSPPAPYKNGYVLSGRNADCKIEGTLLDSPTKGGDAFVMYVE